MRFLKYTISVLVLLVGFSIASMAQDGDKKPPPKPNPPVVIVNTDKKNDKPKEIDDDNVGNERQLHF